MPRVAEFRAKESVVLYKADGRVAHVVWINLMLRWNDARDELAKLDSDGWLADDWYVYETKDEQIKRLKEENSSLSHRLQRAEQRLMQAKTGEEK